MIFSILMVSSIHTNLLVYFVLIWFWLLFITLSRINLFQHIYNFRAWNPQNKLLFSMKLDLHSFELHWVQVDKCLTLCFWTPDSSQNGSFYCPSICPSISLGIFLEVYDWFFLNFGMMQETHISSVWQSWVFCENNCPKNWENCPKMG